MQYTLKRDPASPSSIKYATQSLNIPSDSWIARLWRESDGVVIDDQFLIYSTGEIEERNRTFDILGDFSGRFAIGDDSGGRLILLNQEDIFFLVGAGEPPSAKCEEFKSIEDVLDFIRHENGNPGVGIGDIISIGENSPSQKEVIGIKKALSLNASAARLRAELQTKGCIILHSVYAVKYKKALEDFKHLLRFSDSHLK